MEDWRWAEYQSYLQQVAATPPPLFKLGADTTLKVGDLIHHESMQWNRPLIQATFMQAT